jgi:hypothetical protein
LPNEPRQTHRTPRVPDSGEVTASRQPRTPVDFTVAGVPGIVQMFTIVSGKIQHVFVR